jgi:hypothetical protein
MGIHDTMQPGLLLVLLVVIIIHGGQLTATERADDVTAKPLEDAVLLKDVGAQHGPERRHSRLGASCVVVLMLNPTP